ncbi:hydantoinase B/oxoprolinase family protein [Roseomonas sp. E05]|nr:hydantoinase B/oxoprolinase family protein [Roseomonas sp. E05]MDJ0389059.1 hydantoinase B/oxoprolinase family protein [Roseomonas sp. E05]
MCRPGKRRVTATHAGCAPAPLSTESIPNFIDTLPETVKHIIIRRFPEEVLSPGEVLITSGPWLSTGHPVAKPILRNGRLVAFNASTAHAPDIGDKTRSPELREVFDEGLQIPPIKLVRGGRADETRAAIIRKNARMPDRTMGDRTMGDLWAQAVAPELIEEHLLVLMKQAALGQLADLAAEIPGRCEAAAHRAITTPSATPRNDDVRDQALHSPGLPSNENAGQPISVAVPAGRSVNPILPASGGSRMLIGYYLYGPGARRGALRLAHPGDEPVARGRRRGMHLTKSCASPS